MKILYINSARSFGGGERHTIDLANEISKRGHQVHAALAPGSPLREYLTKIPAQNIHTLRLRNALDVKSALHLARLVRDHHIDIVHAHLGRDYPLAAFAARGHARLIITRHLLRPLSRVHRLVLSRVARVITVSEAVAQVLREQKLFPPTKIIVVHNGVRMENSDATATAPIAEDLPSEMFTIPEDHFVVGTIGELRPHKGQDTFLRAAALVFKTFNSVSFIIAGEDNSATKQYRQQLDDLIAELDLKRVHFVGWLPNIRPFLRKLDVYVSASRFESFGLVIAEALACGTPVVATATSGAREIIRNGVTGILAPVDDVDGLAAAIIELLRDEEQRTRLSTAGREMVRRNFSLERMIEAIEQVYREALEESGN